VSDSWLAKLERFVSFDLETHLIEPGVLSPPIVCGSLAGAKGVGEIVHPRAAVLDRARALLSSDAVIVGANLAFDFGCLVAADPDTFLPLVFKAYAEGRVYDVQIAQALHAIAEGNLGQDPRTGGPTCDPMTGKQSGRYSLAICVDLVLGRVNAKANDEWRLRYAELEHVPLAEWPETARQYPIDDAVNTLEVAIAQVRGGGAGPTPGPHRNLGDLSNQAETAFAMHLGAMWGLRTDPERVTRLRADTEKAHAASSSGSRRWASSDATPTERPRRISTR
jgi:DNA polymerase-1